MFNERIEVPAVIEQFVPVFDASGGDQCIDCFSDGDADATQRTEVPRSLNRDLSAAQFQDFERCQHFTRDVKLPLVGESLKHFG